jgi:hypothetical protein
MPTITIRSDSRATIEAVLDTTEAYHPGLDTNVVWNDMYALHIGVHKDNLESAVLALRKRPEFRKVSADFDGWEAWGEAPNVDENLSNPDARHIVVLAQFYESAITAVQETVGSILVPMVTERQKDVILHVSDPHDWSEAIEDPFTAL